MATNTGTPTEQRNVLHDVAWETYERLLADHVNSSAPRFTYDRGELEILSPSTEHEELNRTVALLVEDVAMEPGIDVRNVGSMTFKRHDLQRGFEPDSSFYVQHEPHVRGKHQLDLQVDPPPDLVIEIEVTQPAIPKLPLYASLGIPGIWRCTSDRRVVISHLAGSEYRAAASSLALPSLTSDTVNTLLADSRPMPRIAWRKAVREWARASIS